MPENKKFWKFCNQAGNKVELLLYGDISQTSWWGDEVTPKIDGLCASAATILLPSVFLVGERQQRERQQHDQAAASERHRFLQGQRGGDRGHGAMN